MHIPLPVVVIFALVLFVCAGIADRRREEGDLRGSRRAAWSAALAFGAMMIAALLQKSP